MKIDCEEVSNLMGMYLDIDSNLREMGIHIQNCPECKMVWSENLRVKEMLKQAVEKESIPQSSIDWIKEKIRQNY